MLYIEGDKPFDCRDGAEQVQADPGLVRQLSRKELPRVVVDHGVQAKARSIENPEERHVHVPELVVLRVPQGRH